MIMFIKKSHAKESRGLRSTGDSVHPSQSPPKDSELRQLPEAEVTRAGHLLSGHQGPPDKKRLVNEATLFLAIQEFYVLIRGFFKIKFLINCSLQLKYYFVKIFIPLCNMLDSHGCS